MATVDPSFEPVVMRNEEDLASALPFTPRRAGVHRFLTSSAGLLGSLLLLILVLAGLSSAKLSPWLLGNTPTVLTLAELQDPWATMRLALAETVPAILPSLAIGVFAGSISALLGLVVGGMAGYFGGWIDALLSRLIEFASALPFLPFAVAVIAATGSVQGVSGLVVIFSLLGWVGTARLVRAQLLLLREQPFTESAKISGVGHLRILVRHLFPNIYPSVLIATVLSMASFMLAEATLDFLRIGVAHTITLGTLLGNFYVQATALSGEALPEVLVPGVTLWLLVLALHLVSEGLQQALDVQGVR